MIGLTMTNLTTTSLMNWLSPSMMHSLGWALLHFLWQGAAVAALAAILMSLCRRASTRYALGVGALALMLAAPIATFFLLTPSPAKFSPVAETRPMAIRNIVVGTSSEFSNISSLDTLPWLVEAWLFGVAFFSLRSAGGFLLIERERRKQSITPSNRVLALCQTMQRQLGLDRTIRYGECLWLQAPAVIGWFRPIVLLPVTALTGLSEEQLQSVIAHELAHIQRLDPFVNLFQISVETLLFYHPAVWWLNKRIRAEREHCCDDIAVSLCGNPVEYARALTLMEEWRSAPTLAMAANRGPLSERIFRVLGRKSVDTRTPGIRFTGGLMCLTAALVAGNALLGIVYPKPIVHANKSTLAQSSHASSLPVKFVQLATASPQSSPAPASAATAEPSPARPQAIEQQSATAGSYIDAMKAAGLDNLTVDELIALKIQNVTPEFVRGMREQGLHLDAESLVAMRIQGVTPEYIHALRGLGLDPDENQIIALKIQGVDATYVRSLQEAGIKPDVDQLIGLKIQAVTPAYVRDLHDLGLEPEANTLIGMRIQGVTPEYVRDIHALGLKPTANEFIAMRVQDVTPEYIKALQAAGFKFDIDDVIGAKVQDITPEFIEKARKHGFQNLTLQKLIQLKHMGILESPGEI
ncbi:MAG: M56 family metallopeptidase [Terriglobales bacterium]|jgi:beta-lactamase regulating signal transducer with metallopeptidase domain